MTLNQKYYHIHLKRINIFARTQCNTSYNDTINSTSHEKVFYLYYLGRYLSKPLYTFGETNDIYSTECYINNKLPYYQLVKTAPIEDNLTSLQKFNDFIECNKTEIPINNIGINNVFTLDDNINHDMLLFKLELLFPRDI